MFSLTRRFYFLMSKARNYIFLFTGYQAGWL